MSDISKKIHDIRGALNSANLSLRCLEEFVPSEDKQIYDTCKTNIDKMKKLLDELHDLIKSQKPNTHSE